MTDQPVLDWDSLTHDEQITELSSAAFYESIKADTPLEVRIEMLLNIREPNDISEEKCLELTGLGVDYSGPGRPSMVIVSPVPKADVLRRLDPH